MRDYLTIFKKDTTVKLNKKTKELVAVRIINHIQYTITIPLPKVMKDFVAQFKTMIQYTAEDFKMMSDLEDFADLHY